MDKETVISRCKPSKKTVGLLAFIALIGAAGAGAYAAFDEGMFAPISGKQAAAAAAAHTGGVATDVDYDYDHQIGGRFRVETVKDNLEYDVLVDAENGKVLSATLDRDDDDDRRHDRHHEDGDRYGRDDAQYSAAAMPSAQPASAAATAK